MRATFVLAALLGYTLAAKQTGMPGLDTSDMGSIEDVNTNTAGDVDMIEEVVDPAYEGA